MRRPRHLWKQVVDDAGDSQTYGSQYVQKSSARWRDISLDTLECLGQDWGNVRLLLMISEVCCVQCLSASWHGLSTLFCLSGVIGSIFSQREKFGPSYIIQCHTHGGWIQSLCVHPLYNFYLFLWFRETRLLSYRIKKYMIGSLLSGPCVFGLKACLLRKKVSVGCASGLWHSAWDGIDVWFSTAVCTCFMWIFSVVVAYQRMQFCLAAD